MGEGFIRHRQVRGLLLVSLELLLEVRYGLVLVLKLNEFVYGLSVRLLLVLKLYFDGIEVLKFLLVRLKRPFEGRKFSRRVLEYAELVCEG